MPWLARNFGALLFAGACFTEACASAPSTHETRAGYRALREHEAALERADAARAGADCEGRRAHARAVCDAAREVCALANTLAETDARERCGQAQLRCTQADTNDTCEAVAP